MTDEPIKQALIIPPIQINRIVAAGMKAVYGLDVEVNDVRPRDQTKTEIVFLVIEPEPVTRLGLGHYHDDDLLAQGEE